MPANNYFKETFLYAFVVAMSSSSSEVILADFHETDFHEIACKISHRFVQCPHIDIDIMVNIETT